MLAAAWIGAVAATVLAVGTMTATILALKVSGKQSQQVALLQKQSARDLDAACSAGVDARRPLRWT
jgi:hypothetical protein